MDAFTGGSILIAYIFGLFILALVIAWIILPFALIGTKPLLRELIKHTKETNRLLNANTKPTVATGNEKPPERASIVIQ